MACHDLLTLDLTRQFPHPVFEIFTGRHVHSPPPLIYKFSLA
jgi:hypothetical protein